MYPFTEGGAGRRARSFGQLNIATIEQELAITALEGSSDTASQSGSESPMSAPSSDASPASNNAAASLAEKVLCKEWDRRSQQGLFRYDVKSCTTKVPPPRLQRL